AGQGIHEGFRRSIFAGHARLLLEFTVRAAMRFPPTDEQSAMLGAVFLAIDLACVVYALVARPTQPDPQRGQAVGCLAIVVVALVLLGVLLAFAWRFHI